MDLLLTEDWDLIDDGNGGIALTPSLEYSIAQTVANEIKLFEGEGWYDRSQGMPHFEVTFQANANWSLIKTIFLNHVNDVDGVVQSDVNFYIEDDRILHGTIYTTTTNGNLMYVQY